MAITGANREYDPDTLGSYGLSPYTHYRVTLYFSSMFLGQFTEETTRVFTCTMPGYSELTVACDALCKLLGADHWDSKVLRGKRR